MEIELIIFEFVNMLEYESLGSWYIEKHEKVNPQNSAGIYFFLYGGSSVPYHIGSSGRMFSERLPYHIATHRSETKDADYWAPRRPEKLANLSCFMEKPSSEIFFGKKYNNCDHPDFGKAMETILKNTTVLFSRIHPISVPSSLGRGFTIQEMGKLKYDVEMILYMNLVKRLGLDTGWIGDENIKNDFAQSLRLPEEIYLSINYEKDTPTKLNSAMLV